MKIHFIGICGKLNAGLAIKLKNLGHEVTGSDKAFYPPMSTLLEKNNLPILVGYKEEYLDENNLPDLVTYGAAIGEDNVEVIKAKKLNIETCSPTQLLEKFVIKKNSIVITGNYGKTTITGLLVKIFTDLNLNPSYMIGGEVPELESVKITNSDWSIIEGDEYPAEKNGKSKFFYYHPKYLIVTSVKWDHTDIFKTDEEYKVNFLNLIQSIHDNGIIIVNENDESFLKDSKFSKLKEDQSIKSEIIYSNLSNYLENDTNSLIFLDKPINPKIFGQHNLENISLALELLKQCFDNDFLKANIDSIINSINIYPGPTRRLQIKFDNVIKSQTSLDNHLVIIDDFAHNPEKFKASISAVADKFKGHKITCIILPNLGNITKVSLSQYQGVFDNVDIDEVIIPGWSTKIAEDSETYANENYFARFLNLNKVKVEKKDDKLIEYLLSKIKTISENHVVLFMGSEPFRGMIDILIQKLNNVR